MQELLSTQEVADRLGVSRSAIYIAVADGRLEPYRSKPYLFTAKQVEVYRASIAPRYSQAESTQEGS